MPICGSYQVYMDGEMIGNLEVSKPGGAYSFEFLSERRFNVSRLICLGTGGEAVSIGIPVPKGSGMYLKKTLSPSALAKSGLEDISKGLLVPVDADISLYASKTSGDAPPPDDAADEDQAEDSGPEDSTTSGGNSQASPRSPPVSRPSGWQPCHDPASLFPPGYLREQCGDLTGALMSYNGDGRLLAFPYSQSSPFPLITYFRFASSRNIAGKTYLVYSFQGDSII